MIAITKAQLQRLQILYGQFAARSLDAGTSREARMAWASEQLGYTVTSFTNLQKDEGTRLIDRLQGALGIPPSKPRRRARREDHAAGMEGRKTGNAGAGAGRTVATLPSAADLDRINNALTRLGWNTAQYEAWLHSVRSPLARKVGGTRIAPADITLRTLRDTNRVWWALKGMLTAKGLWN